MARPLILLILLSLLLGLAVIAQAQGPITIVRSEADYTFQKEVRFTLEATAEAEIVKAILRFRLADQPATNTNEKTVEPARSVTVEHTWNLVNVDLPSGTRITYWWVVEDRIGNRVESNRRNLLYEDTRFTWRRLTRDEITLSWYRGDDELGRELLDSAAIAYQRLAGEFGVERKPASIYIYGSFEDLRSSIGESAQEWTGGRAYPEYNVVLIGVPPTQRDFGRRAVAHEFAHLIIHRATANPFAGLPRWLDEGLAMWAEGELESEYKTALDRAVRTNQLLSLKTLSSNFPADSRQASLAYAQSYSVVMYIREAFGAQKIGELLRVFKEGNTPDAALKQVLGIDTEELDARWRTSIGVQGSTAVPAAQPQQPSGSTLPLRTFLIVGMGLLVGTAIILIALALILVVILRT